MLDLIRDQQGRLNSALVVKWLFIGLLLALCLGRAFGAEVDLELMIFVAGVAGFEDVTYLLRRGQDRRVERARAERPLPDAAMPPGQLDLLTPGNVAYLQRRGLGHLLTPGLTEVHPNDDAGEEAPTLVGPVLDGPFDVGPEGLGVVLYAAYNAGGDPSSAGLNFRGEPCPAFLALPDNVVAKWVAVGQLVVDLLARRPQALNRYVQLLTEAARGIRRSVAAPALAPEAAPEIETVGSPTAEAPEAAPATPTAAQAPRSQARAFL